ncbi:hypothetical protein [Gelria sp. Kuro-4]|uniref:hypothetical protein n=1 Tax=Gelria sp. Kuro-4 TaxID=2796927 RepID=UPI001BF0EF72|nr:hypothetical protein [Gelria sp. Kuro-4]BCV25403.1 membrane protein [Gelria sp. Kuro-4]
MQLTPILALSIVLTIFAVGDVVAIKTKAILSMLFVSSVLLLLGYWSGIPGNLLPQSQLVGIGSVLVGLLITHMGTLMKVRDLLQQWKTVLIAAGAVAGIGIFVFLVGSPLFGRNVAVVAAPPISGGVVAALIMSEAAKAKGFADLSLLATMLLVAQGFIGYPLSSILLTREARRIVSQPELVRVAQETAVGAEGAVDKGAFGFRLPQIPKEYQTNFVLLAKLSLVAYAAVLIAGLFNNVIHPLVVSLVVGIIAREIGLLEDNIFEKANGLGLAMAGLLAVVFGNLASATPAMVTKLLAPLAGTLVLGVIGIGLFSFVLGHLLGYSFEMATTIGLTALYGFPGTYILSHEAAKAVAQNEEEEQAILHHILPKMLVAGFVTVTISSVILAGIFAKLLV